MWSPEYFWHGGFWIMPIIMFTLFIIVMLVFLRYVVGPFGCMQHNHSNTSEKLLPHETPSDILKIRYAKGEIDKEEYERIKKDIE